MLTPPISPNAERMGMFHLRAEPAVRTLMYGGSTDQS